jgi:elongation factor P
MQYLYKDGDNFIFMDLETYEQTTVPEGTVGDTANFLVENQELSVFIRNGKAVTMELPPAVHLKVAEAEPGLKGDTSSGATKPVTLETGLVIQAPLFVNEGETLKVDTRTGRYIERV